MPNVDHPDPEFSLFEIKWNEEGRISNFTAVGEIYGKNCWRPVKVKDHQLYTLTDAINLDGGGMFVI